MCVPKMVVAWEGLKRGNCLGGHFSDKTFVLVQTDGRSALCVFPTADGEEGLVLCFLSDDDL